MAWTKEVLMTAGLFLLALLALPLLAVVAIVFRPILMAGIVVGLLVSLVLSCFSPRFRAWLFEEPWTPSRVATGG